MVKSDLWRIENNANPTRNDCRGDGCRYADISMVVDKITWKQMVWFAWTRPQHHPWPSFYLCLLFCSKFLTNLSNLLNACGWEPLFLTLPIKISSPCLYRVVIAFCSVLEIFVWISKRKSEAPQSILTTFKSHVRKQG